MREHKTIFFFILPAIILVSIVLLFPILGTIYTSFFQDVSFKPYRFIWLKNYIRIFSDTQFLTSLIFTLSFTFVSVSLELIFGIIVALIINESFRGRGIVRGIILLPWAIPSIVSARIWQNIYKFEYGIANYILGLFNIEPINWLSTPISAFIAIVIADVWKTTPFVAIIILAGLQTIPDEIYKQAKIDGTNFLQRFIYITLPLLKPVIAVSALFRTADALRVLDIIYVLTGGGPGGSTTSLSLFSYKYFIMGDFGYGATSSVVLFIIALIISIIYAKLSRFKEELSR